MYNRDCNLQRGKERYSRMDLAPWALNSVKNCWFLSLFPTPSTPRVAECAYSPLPSTHTDQTNSLCGLHKRSLSSRELWILVNSQICLEFHLNMHLVSQTPTRPCITTDSWGPPGPTILFPSSLAFSRSYTNFLASWRHYFPSSAIIPSLRSHSEAGDDGMIFIWHIQIPLQKCPPAERMQFPITFSSLSGGGRSGGRFSGEAIRRASCSCGWGPRSNWRLAYGRRSYIAGCEGKSCASAERNQETGKGKKRKLPIYFGRDKIIIESGWHKDLHTLKSLGAGFSQTCYTFLSPDKTGIGFSSKWPADNPSYQFYFGQIQQLFQPR